MSNELIGRKALVTGAGGRLGRAISLSLAEHGVDVAVHYCRNESGARDTVALIRSLGCEASAFSGDFQEQGSVEKLTSEVLSHFGRLDILINNASTFRDADRIAGRGGMELETEEDWETALAVNARAPYFLIKALAPALEESVDGNVLNLLDFSVTRPFLGRATHSISKDTLLSVNRLAAQTYRGRFRVNALELGAILAGDKMSEDEQNKREWLGTESLTDAVHFVLRSKLMTGEVIGLRGAEHLG